MTSACCAGLGEVGYVAAMEWSSVHEFRPRVSTSAGQSAVAAAGVVFVFAPGAALMDFACAAQAEKALLEVQDRHLGGIVRTIAHMHTPRHDENVTTRRRERLGIRFTIWPQDDTRRQRLRGLTCYRPRWRRSSVCLRFSGI